jgi:hypothetical protein
VTNSLMTTVWLSLQSPTQSADARLPAAPINASANPIAQALRPAAPIICFPRLPGRRTSQELARVYCWSVYCQNV